MYVDYEMSFSSIYINVWDVSGRGLGKDESGRANAIKVGVKYNKLGVCIVADFILIV